MTFYEMIKLIHDGETRPFGRGCYHMRDGSLYYEAVISPSGDEQVMLTNKDIFATDWDICQDYEEIKQMMRLKLKGVMTDESN